MSFLELAKKRYAVRNYQQKEVEEEKLSQILQAGRVAPTAGNAQSQRFLVIKSKAALKKLSNVVNFHGAPLVVVVCGDKEKVWVRPFDSKKMIDIDASIVTDHMMMTAQDLGLGSCWLSYFDPDILRKEFNIPDNFEPVNILALGYAAGTALSQDRHDETRVPLENNLYYDTF